MASSYTHSDRDDASETATPSTAAVLPTGIAVFLFGVTAALVSAATIHTGYRVSFAVGGLGMGLLAGIGRWVGTTAQGRLGRRVIAVVLLWVAALGIIGTMAVSYVTSGSGALALGPLLYLIGYGFVSATATNDETGEGARTLRTFATGAVYVLLFAGADIALTIVPVGDVIQGTMQAVGHASTTLPETTATFATILGAFVLLSTTQAVTYLARRIPLEPIVGIDHLDDIGTATQAGRYTRYAVLIVVVVIVASSGADRLVPSVSVPPAILRGGAVFASPTMIRVMGLVIVATAVAALITRTFNRMADADVSDTVETILPTAMVIGGLWGLQPVGGFNIESALPTAALNIPVVQPAVSQTPAGVVLFAIGLATFGVVFLNAVPGIVAATGIEDRAFAGLLTATLAILALGSLVVTSGGALWGFAAIGAGAVVWDAGEYSMTASAEFGAQTHHTEGFGTLTSLRAIISISVGVLSAIVLWGVFNTLPSSVGNATTAGMVTVVSAIGLGLIYIGFKT